MGSRWSGSSPLARGLLIECVARAIAARIIPARAGFTLPGGAPASPPTDHPRSRGVYVAAGSMIASALGSSPLARGLHEARLAQPRHDRIIPARAGFTSRRELSSAPSGDHPRSRGVYRLTASATARRIGIIPARAGFTGSGRLGAPSSEDHPRSRGVYASECARTPCSCGSSPLARGLHHGPAQPPPDRRIIPARAGFTLRCAPALR